MTDSTRLAEALRELARDWNTSADIAATNGDNKWSAAIRTCALQAKTLLAAHDAQRAELAAAKAEIARLQTTVDRWNRTSIPRGG